MIEQTQPDSNFSPCSLSGACEQKIEPIKKNKMNTAINKSIKGNYWKLKSYDKNKAYELYQKLNSLYYI